MAKAALKVYPYVYLDARGKHQFTAFSATPNLKDRPKDVFEPSYGGSFTIYLDPIEVEVDIPEDFTEKCLSALGQTGAQIEQEFKSRKYFMAQVRNQLLRLPAPDILDAE